MNSTISNKRRLLLASRTCKGASYWLTTPPSIRHNSCFDKSSFRLLLKFHLGLPLFAGTQNCPDCFKPQDSYGHHAISCNVAAGPIHRHDSLVHCITDYLRKAKVSCATNVGCPKLENLQRPGDIFINDFDNFGDAYLDLSDLSVINVFADAYFKRASKGVLEGSKIRYTQKKRKYEDLGHKMKPLVVQCTGGWNPYSLDY